MKINFHGKEKDIPVIQHIFSELSKNKDIKGDVFIAPLSYDTHYSFHSESIYSVLMEENRFVIKLYKKKCRFGEISKVAEAIQARYPELTKYIILPDLAGSVILGENGEILTPFEDEKTQKEVGIYYEMMPEAPGKTIYQFIDQYFAGEIGFSELSACMNKLGRVIGKIHYTGLVEHEGYKCGEVSSLVHNDLGYANIIFDSKNNKIYLIDNETFTKSLSDKELTTVDLERITSELIKILLFDLEQQNKIFTDADQLILPLIKSIMIGYVKHMGEYFSLEVMGEKIIKIVESLYENIVWSHEYQGNSEIIPISAVRKEELIRKMRDTFSNNDLDIVGSYQIKEEGDNNFIEAFSDMQRIAYAEEETEVTLLAETGEPFYIDCIIEI